VDEYRGGETFRGILQIENKTEYLPTGEKLTVRIGNPIAEPVELHYSGKYHRISETVY